MSNGMELQVFDLKHQATFLTNQQERLERWCTGGEVRSDALVRHALAEMEVDENLRSCTPTSIYLALLSCAVTGLVPGKLRGHAFLVPFTNTYGHGSNEVKRREATFMVGWKGVKHQGFRAGIDMLSAVIHRNDVFDYDVGTNCFVRYRAALEGGGPVIGTAAWARLPRGGLEVEYLPIDVLNEIELSANRVRKSPAWNGPFKDQMQRKSALRRLGKQLEMGQDFFKGQALEEAVNDGASVAGVLDEFTDGDATRVLARQSTESAVFSGAPRPTQVQVPAALPAGPGPSTPQASPQASPQAQQQRGNGKGGKGKPIEAQASERPTTGSSAPQTSSSSVAAPASSATPAAVSPSISPTAGSSPAPVAGAGGAGSPTSPTPVTSTATSAKSSSPASASPAVTSPVNSTPSNTNQPAASASGGQPPPQGEPAEGFGDVAGEPGPDEAFDTSFGDDQTNDPVDRQPQTRADWIAAFQNWSSAHPTRDDVIADDSWVEVFRGWANACASKAEMDEDKPLFQAWSKNSKLTFGRKADPAKGVTAVPPDRQILVMQDEFAKRYKAVP